MYKVVVGEFNLKENNIYLNNIEFDNLSTKQVVNLLTLSNKKYINHFHIYRNGEKVFSLYYKVGNLFRMFINNEIYFRIFLDNII